MSTQLQVQDTQTIHLCGRDIVVAAQTIGYLKHRVLQVWAQAKIAAEDLNVADIDRGAYELLVAIAPDVAHYVELYRFLGFGSAEAMEAGDYRREDDHGVTIPELKTAFAVACEVSGLDLIAQLKGLIPLETVQGVLGDVLEEAAEEMRAQRLISSLSSPSETDGSDPSTSSGTTPRTSEAESAGSPSPASTA